MASVGQISGISVIGEFIAPAFIGNVIGGVALVAALNHAQVVAGSAGEDI